MRKKKFYLSILAGLMLAAIVVLPVAAQGPPPYQWPPLWQAGEGGYNVGVAQAARGQWAGPGDLYYQVRKVADQPVVDQLNAGLQAEIAAKTAAAASAAANTTITPVFMVNPAVTSQTTYDSAGFCTSSYDWYTGSYRTVCNY